MTKLGVGVGEEFPVDEATPKEPESETDGRDPRCGGGGHWHRRHGGRWHFAGHVLFRLAILGLLIGGAMSFFGRHFDHDHFHAVYPYPHHFFFPFFGIALLVALVFWRSRWHHRHWHHGHGHDEHDRTGRVGDKEST